MNQKRYHVHGLEGYSKFSYKYVGNFKYLWIARLNAINFVSSYPYGMVAITNSKDMPLIK